jgi:hypothetical protein
MPLHSLSSGRLRQEGGLQWVSYSGGLQQVPLPVPYGYYEINHSCLPKPDWAGCPLNGMCLLLGVVVVGCIPCPISTSTCRNFATIFSGLGLLIAIYGPPFDRKSALDIYSVSIIKEMVSCLWK